MLSITVRNPLAQKGDNSGLFSELDDVELPFAAKVFAFIIAVLVVGALYFGFVLLVVWAWLFMFIKIAHYDYVTTSSILFCLFVIPTYFYTIIYFFLSKKTFQTIISTIIVFIVYPLCITASLSIFELAWHPVISDQLNFVQMYRDLPAKFAQLVSGVLPAASSVIALLDGFFGAHPTASAYASSATTTAAGLVTGALGIGGRRRR